VQVFSSKSILNESLTIVAKKIIRYSLDFAAAVLGEARQGDVFIVLLESCGGGAYNDGHPRYGHRVQFWQTYVFHRDGHLRNCVFHCLEEALFEVWLFAVASFKIRG
jgi:hypothetical protein